MGTLGLQCVKHISNNFVDNSSVKQGWWQTDDWASFRLTGPSQKANLRSCQMLRPPQPGVRWFQPETNWADFQILPKQLWQNGMRRFLKARRPPLIVFLSDPLKWSQKVEHVIVQDVCSRYIWISESSLEFCICITMAYEKDKWDIFSQFLWNINLSGSFCSLTKSVQLW